MLGGLCRMEKEIKQLEAKGFRCDGSAGSAKYYSKGADHRVVLADGAVKRGRPEHRARAARAGKK